MHCAYLPLPFSALVSRMYLVDEVLVVVVPHLDLLIVPVLEVGLAPVGVGLQPQALALVRLALQAAVRTQPPQLPTNQSEVSTAVVSTNHSSPGRPCPSCAPSTRGGCPAPASARGPRPARSLCTPRGLQIRKFMAGGYFQVFTFFTCFLDGFLINLSPYGALLHNLLTTC